jgi:hypothetical protein
MSLVKQIPTKKDVAVEDALAAAQLDQESMLRDRTAAVQYLKDAVAAAKSDTAEKTAENLAALRSILVEVLETQRQNIRRLVNEMTAEDKARRKLCDPVEMVAVTCADGICRYFSADPNRPLPCGELVYLNAFPIEAIQAITEHPERYGQNADLYVDLARIVSTAPITRDNYDDTYQMFGADVRPEKLLPPKLASVRTCDNIRKYSMRLTEALEYLSILKDAQDRSSAIRANIVKALSLRPEVDYWIEDLSDLAPADECSTTSDLARAKLDLLIAAVGELEAFGTAATAGDSAAGEATALNTLVTLTRDL